MTLNPIGSNSPCDTWTLSSRRYFTSIFLGYKTDISYLRATTNDGIDFERGSYISSDQNVTISFNTDTPLVGLNGYSSNKILNSLGFIKQIKCDAGNFTDVANVSNQNVQTVDVGGIIIPVNEEGTGWSSTLTAIAVSVYLFGFILGLTSFSLTKILYLRMRSKINQNHPTGG